MEPPPEPASADEPEGAAPEPASADEGAAQPEQANALQPTPPATPRDGKVAQASPASSTEAVTEAVAGRSAAGREGDDDEEDQAAGHVLDDMQQYKKEMKKVALLRNVPFCKSLSEPVILRLAKTMKRVTHVRGENVITEGDEGDALYIVETGELEIHIKSVGIVDRTYGKADFFGEIAVLEDHAPRRAATIRVKSPAATCLQLMRDDVGPVLAELQFAAAAAHSTYRFPDPLAGKKRKLLLYLLFLVIFVVAANGARPRDLYHQNALVENSFRLQDVESVGSWDDVFSFLQEVLLPQLYSEDLLPGSGYPLQLVTGYQIRQVRVSQEQRHTGLWQRPGQCEASSGPRPRARFVHIGHLHRAADTTLAEAETLAHRWGGCSEPFSTFAEETTEPFGNGMRQWEYTPHEEMIGMDTASYQGVLGTYPPGGFIAIPRPASNGSETAVAPSSLIEARDVVETLRADGFIDRYTRAVITDFTVADTQLGLISAIKVTLEFSTQGRVVGSFSAKTVRHVPIFEVGSLQAWIEGFVAVMVLIYLADEMQDLVTYLLLKSRAQTQITLSLLQGQTPPAWTNISRGDNYLADPWNALDILNYILFIYVIVYELLSRWEMDQATETVNEMYLTQTHLPVPLEVNGNLTGNGNLTRNGNLTGVPDSSCAAFGDDSEACEAAGCGIVDSHCTAVKRMDVQEFYPVFVNFYSACEDSCFAFTVLGVNSIITWLKLLKYLNAFPHLAMMSKTVANALAPSFSFMVMFFIFFIGCAQAFTLVFGGNLDGFQDLGAAMLTLFRALIGDFDVEAMTKVDQLVGPLLFISFIILGSLFLLNVFIAILSEAYEKAKIQVFGDSFDEHDEFWQGAPTFNEYFREHIMAKATRWLGSHCVRTTKVAPESTPVSSWILEKLRKHARAAQRRVASGDRLLADDTGNFSLTSHIKGIERMLRERDDKEMQTAIDEIRSDLQALRSAILPDGDTSSDGTRLPPVKVPPHMT